MVRHFGISTLFILALTNGNSQDLTNEGTDFWVGFTEVYNMSSANFEINITAKKPTTGKISIQGGSGFTETFNVTPGLVTTIQIPSKDAHNGLTEEKVNRAIHVESTDPISVFASTYNSQSHSESTVCLPSQSLGSDYMITSYPYEKADAYSGGYSSGSEFLVVCGPQPIQVEITPSCLTNGGNPAGEPFIVNLIPGEMYQVIASLQSPSDLTGSRIRATNGTDLFAVFNGNKMTPISLGIGCNSPCPLYEVAYPTKSWGYEHILILTKSQKRNLFRVVALSDDCHVFENGILVDTLNSGEIYTGVLRSESSLIRTTKKSSVTQFMISLECTGTGDPSMVMLNPNEQMNLKSVSFHVGFYNGIFNHYVSVITRTSDLGKITLDGLPLTGFKPVTSDTSYSFTVINTLVGSHTLTTAGDGFLAYCHGHIMGESYFYSAGAQVNHIADTTQQLPATVVFPFLNDEDVLFSEQLATNHTESINVIAEILIDNPDLAIDVNGYTSTPGDSLYNLQLAADRAKTVRDYIVAQIRTLCAAKGRIYNFNESRIAVNSFGEDLAFLIEKNDNDLVNDDELMREAKQAKNRRVEVAFKPH